MSTLNSAQQAVVQSDADKLLVLAGAGAGKTFTMLSRIQRLVSQGVEPTSILVLTFTNKAAFDMRDRYLKQYESKISPEFRTFHAFCYHVIVTDLSVRNALGYKYVPTIADDATVKAIETEAKLQSGVKLTREQLSGKSGCLSLKDKDELKLYQKFLKRIMKQKSVITFNMLSDEVTELFVADAECIRKYKEQYKYIFVDEFQDTNSQQVQFLSSFSDAHFCFVGDALQCQPAGTKVKLTDGSSKLIENIKKGDRVIGYDTDSKKLKMDLEVTDTAVRRVPYVLKVHAAGVSSRYTPDHLTYASMNKNVDPNLRCVMLLRNHKGWWRVAEGPIKTSDGKQYTASSTMHKDRASAVWILAVTPSEHEAWRIKHLAAHRFGIPDITWRPSRSCRFNLNDLQKLYNNLPNLEYHAEKCLTFFGRDVVYPFDTAFPLKKIPYTSDELFVTSAGYLVPQIMNVAVQTGDELTLYPIERIIPDNESQLVYSLAIEDTHNYIADRILTHNCIYQFRGTSNQFIKMLSADDHWEKHRLSANYRSTNQICNYANQMSKYASSGYRIEMEGQREGAEVEVITGASSSWPDLVDKRHMRILTDRLSKASDSSDIAILCRTNKEVQYVCEELKRHNILYSAKNRNSDALYLLQSAKSDEYMINWLSSCLKAEQYAEFIRLFAQHKADSADASDTVDAKWFIETYGSNPQISQSCTSVMKIRGILNSKKATVSKTGDILQLLGIKAGELAEIESDADILPKLTELLEEQGNQSIYVGTIHSSKGLEYDTVYVIGVNDKSFQLDSEEMNNLCYVALTRAKNHLVVFTV